MTASETFEELLSMARLGDVAAIARLVEQYEPEVRMVARARLGAALRPYLDSMDLVQSVHRSLMLGLRADQFDITSPDKLIALAVTIVRRKVARHWRKLKRQQRLPASGDDPEGLPQLLLALTSADDDPAEQAALQDAAERVFAELDEVERRLIQLRWEGNSTAEVARQLGLDPDVLRVKLGRLRRRLRERGIMSEWL